MNPLSQLEMKRFTREICQMCHEVSRVGFLVPKEIWLAGVRKGFADSIVCLSCFTRIADEKQIEWDKEIKFFPVSQVTHRKLLQTLRNEHDCFSKRTYGQCACPNLLPPSTFHQKSDLQSLPQFQESVMRESYAWKTDKKCVDYLAHNINWCGDCYACSNCALIFVPISKINEAYKLGEDTMRERVVDYITKAKILEGMESSQYHAVQIFKNGIISTLKKI